MIAAGIDAGGTKIEMHLFDADWQIVDFNRMPTPTDYKKLVAAVVEQVYWVERKVGRAIPVGLAFPGLIDRKTGLALTANLSATGQPLQRDINKVPGRIITFVYDCRALVLSEAVFGSERPTERFSY